MATLITVCLACGVGWAVWQLKVGEKVRLAGYDLPYLFWGPAGPADVAVVFLDDATYAEYEQPLTVPWDRTFHAKLVEEAGGTAVI